MDQHLTAATPWNRKPNLSVRLTDIPYDRRAVSFIESVCASLIEDRFGPGRTANFVLDPNYNPELEPAVNYDLTNTGMLPYSEISPISRNTFQQMEIAIRRAKTLGLINPGQNGHSYTNASDDHLGRGSPAPPRRPVGELAFGF